MEDFTSAQVAFTPMSLRGVSLQKSDTKWSDIGGELLRTRLLSRELTVRPARAATGLARDAGMADQICPDLCQLPIAITFWVSWSI